MTRQAHPPHGSRAGFTLIEVLVSLAIMALVAAMLGQGVWSALRLEQRADDQRFADDRVASARTLIAERIAALEPVIRRDSSSALVEGSGTSTSFTFFAAPLGVDAPAPPQRFRLAVAAGGTLTLYSVHGLDRRFDFRTGSLEGWKPVPLLEDVAGIELAYYGTDRDGRGRRWRSEWEKHPQPPELVRLNVRFPPGDDRFWPELVVRPRATVNTACRIDPQSGRCSSF